MDFIRSCYECDVYWDAEGNNRGRIRWYFVDNDARPLDVPNAFCSDVWSPGKYSTVAVGEIWTSDRPHANGKPLGPYPKDSEPCGKLEWYSQGCPSDAPVLPQNQLHQALCCIPASGLLLGGTSVVRIRYLNGGGIEPGGTSTITSSLEGTGGIEPGGTSTLRTISIHYGGLLLGATSELLSKGSYYGGLLLGGTSVETVTAVYYGTGGLLLGGTSRLSPRYITYGGLLLGGTSRPKGKITGTGGIEVGATSRLKTKAVSTGGVLLGGTSVYQIKLTDACCGATVIPGVIQVAAPMAIGGTFLMKYKTTTTRWEGTDNAGHAWTLQCVAGVYQLRETIGTCTSSSNNTLKTCATFTLRFTLTLTGGGCAQAGSYIVNITPHTSPT